MDIGKYFGIALRTLRRRPVLMLPTFTLSILSMLGILLFLSGSGLLMPLVDYVDYVEAKDQRDWDAFAQEGTEIMDNEAYWLAMEAPDPEGEARADALVNLLMTQNTLVWALASVIILALLSIFLLCMHYVLIASVVRKKPLQFGSILSWTSWSLIRLIATRLLIGLLYLAPLVLIVLLVLLMAKLSVIATIAVGFIGAFIYMAYTVYIWLKFLFVIPDLFLHDRRPMIALNKSFAKTKGFMLQVFVVGLIESVLLYFAQLSNSAPLMVWSIPVIVVLSVIGATVYAALFTLKDLFKFYTWEGQKDWVQ